MTAIFTVNFFFRGHGVDRPPRWLRRLVLQCLARVVLLRGVVTAERKGSNVGGPPLYIARGIRERILEGLGKVSVLGGFWKLKLLNNIVIISFVEGENGQPFNWSLTLILRF